MAFHVLGRDRALSRVDTGLSPLVPPVPESIRCTDAVFPSPLLLGKGKRDTADGFVQTDPLKKALAAAVAWDSVSSASMGIITRPQSCCEAD